MTNEHSLEVLGDFAPEPWFEVRMFPEDFPWIYESEAKAFRKARRVADRSAYPVLVYECSREGSKLIGIAE